MTPSSFLWVIAMIIAAMIMTNWLTAGHDNIVHPAGQHSPATR